MRRSVVLLAAVTLTAMAGVIATSAASAPPLTSPPVAPIAVNVGKLVKECDSRGKNCAPGLYRPVSISFVARENLAAGVSWYELSLRFTPTGPCPVEQGGMGGPTTPSALRAGKRATWDNDVINCPRIVHGAIVYDTSTAPHSHRYVPNVGPIDGALVGTFSFRMS